MDQATRELVRSRAGNRCEYCHMPQEATPFVTFHVEHIVAKQHLDVEVDDASGLCLACDRCNSYKGPNLSSIDPISNEKVDLYNPREDAWHEHFEVRGAEIIGISPTGRATARLLNMNAPRRVELRQEWLKEGESLQ